MSNHNEGDFGRSDRDAAERATAEINLDEPERHDDEPWSPPDREPRGAELAEVEDETLSMRLMQEEPDPTAAIDDESHRWWGETTPTPSRRTRTCWAVSPSTQDARQHRRRGRPGGRRDAPGAVAPAEEVASARPSR